MHKIFAIEPKVIWDRDVFSFLRDKFGPNQGRRIGLVPRKWANEVKRCGSGPHVVRIEKWLYGETRENGFVRVKDPRFVRLNLAATENLHENSAWRDKALSVIDQLDFVIAFDGPEDNRWILIDEDERYRKYHVLVEGGCQRDEIPRTSEDYNLAMDPFLEGQERFKWIDYCFNPDKKRFLIPLEGFIQHLNARGNITPEIEIHTLRPELAFNDKRPSNKVHWQDKLNTICKDARVSVWWWSDNRCIDRRSLSEKELDRMHPRYILCRSGGIHLDAGLDVVIGDNPGNTVCHLVSRDTAEVEWREFSLEGSRFSMEPDTDLFKVYPAEE